MRYRMQTMVCCTAILAAVGLLTITAAETTPFNKAQVADRIRKVEKGVNDFDKYLTTRGEGAQDNAAAAKAGGAKKRREAADPAKKAAGKEKANQSKDELENAMDDLNRTTNRLRRKFDAASNYLETRLQMEQVMEHARRVNKIVAKGNNATQVERLWTPLRANINELAHCYNIDPLDK